MFTILGQPFLFLSHVFLFRNWFQVYITLGDTWVRDSGTSSCFFHIVCSPFEGSSVQISGHWELCHPWIWLRMWAFWENQTQASVTAVIPQIIPGFWFPGFMWSKLWIYAANTCCIWLLANYIEAGHWKVWRGACFNRISGWMYGLHYILLLFSSPFPSSLVCVWEV